MEPAESSCRASSEPDLGFSMARDAYARLAEVPMDTRALVASAGKVREGFQESSSRAWEGAEALAQDTAGALAAVAQEAIEACADDEVTEWEVSAKEATAAVLTMPFPIVIAGLLAPMQLGVLVSVNTLLLAEQSATLLLLLTAMLFDSGKPCGLWAWTGIMATILALACLLRLRVVYMARHATGAAEGAEGPAVGSEDFLSAFWRRLNAPLQDYFVPLFKYDRITHSWLYSLQRMVTCAWFIWGAAGVYVTIAYIVEDQANCDARFLRGAARLHAFLFVATSLWRLFIAALWLLCQLLAATRPAVVRCAWRFDEAFLPPGVPLATLLVRALLLRDARDMAAVEASVLRSEVAALKQEQRRLQAEAATLENEQATVEEKLQALPIASSPSMAEFAEQYCEQLGRLAERAEVLQLAIAQQWEAHSASSGKALAEDLRAHLAELAASARLEGLAPNAGAVEEFAQAALLHASEAGLDVEQLVRESLAAAGSSGQAPQPAAGESGARAQ